MSTFILRRGRSALWLATGLVLGLLLASTQVASGRHPPKKQNSTAGFNEETDANGNPVFTPPAAFTCTWVENRGGQPVHDYECTAPQGTPGNSPFRMKDALTREGNPPFDSGMKGLAVPRRFSCEGDDSRHPSHFRCEYRHRHGPGERRHDHTFRIDEMVSVSSNDADTSDPTKDSWYVKHRHGEC